MKRLALMILPAIAACAATPSPVIYSSRASGISGCAQDIAFGRYPVTIMSGGGLTPALTVTTEYGLDPGALVYAEINGQRWAAERFIEVTPDLEAALLSGGTLNVSFVPWPFDERVEQSVSLANFKGECL